MKSTSVRRPSHSRSKHKEFLSKRISPAVKDEPCPICLCRIDEKRAAVIATCLHAYCLDCLLKWSNYKRKCPLCNADFHSYFSNINLSSRTFYKRFLPSPVRDSSQRAATAARAVDGSHRAIQRVIRTTRGESNRENRGSRPLRRLRSFGRGRSVDASVIAERALRWRASIYERRLQAVPLRNSSSRQLNMSMIEPWIRRELSAILQDPDPTIIVHVVTHLLISRIEGRTGVSSGHSSDEANFFAPLQRFLHERTNMFWHELRCFTESGLTMDTYDEVVEYTQAD